MLLFVRVVMMAAFTFCVTIPIMISNTAIVEINDI